MHFFRYQIKLCKNTTHDIEIRHIMFLLYMSIRAVGIVDGFAQVAIQTFLMIDVDWVLINGWWFAAIIYVEYIDARTCASVILFKAIYSCDMIYNAQKWMTTFLQLRKYNIFKLMTIYKNFERLCVYRYSNFMAWLLLTRHLWHFKPSILFREMCFKLSYMIHRCILGTQLCKIFQKLKLLY